MADLPYAGAKKPLFAALLLIFVVLMATNLLAISLLFATSLLVSYSVGWLKMRAVGVELVTFITVISALAYGTFPAALIGLMLMAFHIIIAQYSGAYVLWVVPEYALAAVLAGAIAGSVAFVGVAVTLILHAINIALTLAFSREHFPKFLPYVITNILFNALIFTQAGEAVLGMMK